ncbi:hypothetical protein TNCV_2515881 [Trichonephila clavipes]|nr:hypothetical protein TNCV_2515881 [Trichonephila clavipes]
MPSPGFEPRPYGTAVKVTSRYTGWAAYLKSLIFNQLTMGFPFESAQPCVSRKLSNGEYNCQSLMPISVFGPMGTEVHKRMFRSGSQSDVKSPVFSSQASLTLCKDLGFTGRKVGVREARLAKISQIFIPENEICFYANDFQRI